jgi:hypothetical protein
VHFSFLQKRKPTISRRPELSSAAVSITFVAGDAFALRKKSDFSARYYGVAGFMKNRPNAGRT